MEPITSREQPLNRKDSVVKRLTIVGLRIQGGQPLHCVGA